MSEHHIRIIMPMEPGGMVRIQDAVLSHMEREPTVEDYGQVHIPQDQWNRILEKAKNGELDIEEGLRP